MSSPASGTKGRIRAVLMCLMTGGLFAAAFIPHEAGAQVRQPEPSFVAHEWGTLTSVAGSDGQAVEWLPLTGSIDLPGFVERFNGFVYKAGLRGTVRMETPVIYFYAAHDMAVSVHVSFTGGLITEWYPRATRVTPDRDHPDIVLKQKLNNGGVWWDSVAVQPGLTADFPREAVENHYYAARETSAAPVSVNVAKGKQHEKFLFYRGVSSFAVPVSARLNADGSLLVRSPGGQEMPGVIWFERRGDRIGYRFSGAVQDQAVLQPPDMDASLESLYNDLEQILVARGLYRDEAHAMLETWRNSWFEEGSRLFYIVPTQFVDSMVPLTIDPLPSSTVRVFVGRMEVITPATQDAVAHALLFHDNVTVQKYSRFLEPIMERISEKDKALGKQLQEALNPPCLEIPEAQTESRARKPEMHRAGKFIAGPPRIKENISSKQDNR